MKLKNIRIGTQLKFSFIFSMFLVILLGLVSYFQSYELHRKTVVMYDHSLTVERALSNLKSDVIALHRDMKDLSLDTEAKDIKVELDWVKFWKKEGNEQINIIYNSYLGRRIDVDSLKQCFDTLNNVCEKTIDLMRTGNSEEVFKRTKTFGIIGYKVDAVMAKLQVVTDFAIKKGDELYAQSLELKNSLDVQLIILVALILLFSIIINIVLYKHIRRPITELTRATHLFKKGDLTARSSYVSENEFGKLSASFNDMVALIKFQTEEKEKRAEELGIVKGRAEVNESINEELRQTNEELIIAKDRAEESDRLKSAFLANMSHEIRTPMNGILGFTGLLSDPDVTYEKQAEYIKIIKSSGKRLLNIINDIINISKIESGLMALTIKETNINEQAESLSLFFKPEADSKGIHLLYKNSLPAAEAMVKTDGEKVYAILTNLIKNAIKFTKAGSIEFGCIKKGEYIEFFVKDTGIGIRPEQKEFIFERFRQGNEDFSRGYEGSGLGLSISKAYVEMLGGKIWVESEEGKGSVFRFTIPANAAT